MKIFEINQIMQLQSYTEATTLLIALLLVFYCLIQWKNRTDTKRKQPPSPSPSWPIIGHLHLIKGLPHIALGNLADKYGPIFMIKLGVRRALVVSNAEMAKECLSGINDNVFLNRPQSIFVEHMAYNSAMFAFSPHGQYWRDMRKMITAELLSNHQVEMFKNVRISEVRTAINTLAHVGLESVVDMKQWFGDINLNIIVRLVSGRSFKELYQGEDYDRCTRAFRDFFELNSLFPGDVFPFLRWFDIGGYERRLKKSGMEIDRVAQRWLEDHKQRRGSKQVHENHQDFMDAMLSFFETDRELEKTYEFEADTIIKATSILMILGATDTSTATLIWALSLLLNNKDILKKAQAELDTTVGKERRVEESDLKKLVYLQAILKEAMRLYPAGPLSLPRESITDCIVGGYHIPARTTLLLSLHKIHNDPQTWEDPLVFNPERFLTTHKDYDVRGQHYDLAPFGSGKRICPGISFALQNMQFILANLLHGFEISLPSIDQTVDMTHGRGITNLKATPLEVMLTRRLPHNLYDEPTMAVDWSSFVYFYHYPKLLYLI